MKRLACTFKRPRLDFPKAEIDSTISPQRPEAHPEVLKRESRNLIARAHAGVCVCVCWFFLAGGFGEGAHEHFHTPAVEADVTSPSMRR